MRKPNNNNNNNNNKRRAKNDDDDDDDDNNVMMNDHDDNNNNNNKSNTLSFVNEDDDDSDNDSNDKPITTKKKKKKNDKTISTGFKSLGLSDEVNRGIVRMGFRMPTPVQRKALPVILTGVDSVVMARTGSGKTIAFLVPLLEKLLALKKNDNNNNSNHHHNNSSSSVKGIILSPTRELSQQTMRVFNKLIGKDSGIRVIGIHGAESMEHQFHLLASKPDVIIATPGRLAHHLHEIPDFHLNHCSMCILDEADRLLEMGFTMQIRQIAKTLPESCQKVLLSATMPKVLVDFTMKHGFATDPTMVRLDQEVSVSAELRISFITCRSTDKDAALLTIMNQIHIDKADHPKDVRTGLTLIFAATRHHVEYITTLLQASSLYQEDVTMIYGTLDQEARKNNLHAFKTGKKSILVVTDVAARGIDVPLIDHVIHYHFPSSSKLFVHRSGRAARAGRIGFCWSLVEPDEMPYMIDLHLFLGRRPCNSRQIKQQQQNKEEEDEGKKHDTIENCDNHTNMEYTYTLDEMTPEMVHYGSLPESIACTEVENVQRIMNSELSSSKEAEALRALTKVCNNAMKQYRRTRPEASKDAVRRAKAILEGERLETGQRIGNGGTIPPHPLLRDAEIRLYNAIHNTNDDGTSKTTNDSSTTTSTLNLNSLENLRQREDFLRAMSNFRPKETVFEAFATGRNKDAGIVSQVDKGRTKSNVGVGKNKNDSTAALTAMKNMRRQMRMARDKGSTLIVAGSAYLESTANKEHEHHNVIEEEEEYDDNDEPIKKSAFNSLSGPVVPDQDSKRRLSQAERRRLKKQSATTDVIMKPQEEDEELLNEEKSKKKRKIDFRDPTYFIDNDTSSNHEEAQRARQIEAQMQPASAYSSKGSMGHALRMEEAMLDIVGDENEELIKRQRMLRWDKSKRKYVQTTIGAELSGDSKSKKTRLESGQIMKSDKMKLGELYEKWQKKTNRSIGRTGIFDDDDDNNNNNNNAAAGADGVENTKTNRNQMTKNPNHKNGKGSLSKKNNMKGNKNNDDNEKYDNYNSNHNNNTDKVKSALDIKKERAKKQDMKVKNMKRSDRRHMLANKKGSSSSNNKNFDPNTTPKKTKANTFAKKSFGGRSGGGGKSSGSSTGKRRR